MRYIVESCEIFQTVSQLIFLLRGDYSRMYFVLTKTNTMEVNSKEDRVYVSNDETVSFTGNE